MFLAGLVCGLVLEQAERGAAEDAEVGVGVAFADAALILLKRHIELPVPIVFGLLRRICW